MTASFPRLSARTQRFTLGIPRSIRVSPDGRFVRFIRTPDGTTRTGLLWEFDITIGEERLLADPRELLAGDETLSAAEQSRRERSREAGTGITSWSSDNQGVLGCFALSGELFVTEFATGDTFVVATEGSVIDPQLDPTGALVAFATAEGDFAVVNLSRGGAEILRINSSEPVETWGQAEFIAAEEMNRFRGFWWSPDGRSVLVQQTDETNVPIWHIADPARPSTPARQQRYPAAGTTNAVVRLWHIDLADGSRTEIIWDRDAFEYLARVSWTTDSDPVVQVLSRDQRASLVLEADTSSGHTTVLRELSDPAWVELGPAPRRDVAGRLITCEDVDGRRRLCADGEPFSPASWYIREILDLRSGGVVATASSEPTEIQVVEFGFDGSVSILSEGPGVHSAVFGGPTTVLVSTSADSAATTVTVETPNQAKQIKSAAEVPPRIAEPLFVELGARKLSGAVLFPAGHERGSRKLPILLDPYGGPHAQRVLAAGRMFLEAQWLADQGFAVLVCDGRGTPGRSPEWERTIHNDFAGVTLDDQVDAVKALAEMFPDDVDSSRVGISGWSYGGYLAALAVLDRPDVFHVAVAGAPVTEWRLYDTCYTERYLGDPNLQPDVYDRNSLLPRAPKLSRPLMLIHGLADDNVVAAHTLQLSSALLAAGRAHTVLPLSGVTHMTPQEEVAENLKLLQLEFLSQHLTAQP